jgi:hypothetical protein
MTRGAERSPIDPDAPDDDRLAFAYDRDSDTLIVHLRGLGRAAVGIEAGDHAYVRRDRAAGEVVGLHLENFLRGIVPRYPELLDHAATYGIEPPPRAPGRYHRLRANAPRSWSWCRSSTGRWSRRAGRRRFTRWHACPKSALTATKIWR